MFKIVISTVFILNPVTIFSSGNDADVYHAFALGDDLVASSAWPYLLLTLNELGLYSRISTTFLMMLLSTLVIPLMCGQLSSLNTSLMKNKKIWVVPLVVSLYPTLFYYGLDIYRDVIMVFVFLTGLLLVRSAINSRKALNKVIYTGFIFIFGYILFLFRGYLGFAFIIAFLGFRFFEFKNFSIFSLISALIVLNVLFAFGYLNIIIEYRNLFNDVEGTTNLNIRFDSIWFFLPNVINNFIAQILGVFFPNITTILIFIFESIPFFFAFAYVLCNRKYSNSFVDFLVLFFVVYSAVWLLGNDNLGTALRLRMFNYLIVVISCMIIFQRKKENRNKKIV